MEKSKEVIFVTQSGATGWRPKPEDLTNLEKDIKDKTGKDVIVLGPGMAVETVTFKINKEE